MEVAERIRAAGNDLTAAERRVAEVILARPHAVGFGTVADLASASGAGAATVVRLAGKLGFDGYTDLQSSVQRDLLHQLRPAADRIRDEIGDGTMARHLATELGNVQATLDEVDSDAFAELVTRLCDLEAGVAVLSGNASDGVARQFAGELALLRPAVARLAGNEVAVRRDISLLPQSTTVVVIDVRRYDSWVLESVATARATGNVDRGADGQLPLADRGRCRPHVRPLGRVGGAVRQPRRHPRAPEPRRHRGRRSVAIVGFESPRSSRGSVEGGRVAHRIVSVRRR